MGTRPVDPEQAAERLSAGTRRWIGLHAGYLDSAAGRAELPQTPRVKALLQLALLCRCWRRTGPADASLTEAAGVVERAWRRPDLPRLLTLKPKYARQFQLMYAALAPAGSVAAGAPAAVDADLSAPGRMSPYLHLETRFYADQAGVAHRLAPYPELYASSLLARAFELPAADLDVCEITHTVFYLSDFGLRDPALPAPARAEALGVVERLTDHCVGRGEWDLAGKLLLAQHCLGADPQRTPSGKEAIRMLAQAQSPGGAIPGKSAAERAAGDANPVDFFRRAYQATVVTALAMLIVTDGRRPVRPAAQAATTQGAR